MLLLSCLIIPFSNKFIQITMVIRVNDDYSIETVLNPIVASKLVTNGCFINDRGHHILIYTVIISSKSPEGRIAGPWEN